MGSKKIVLTGGGTAGHTHTTTTTTKTTAIQNNMNL